MLGSEQYASECQSLGHKGKWKAIMAFSPQLPVSWRHPAVCFGETRCQAGWACGLIQQGCSVPCKIVNAYHPLALCIKPFYTSMSEFLVLVSSQTSSVKRLWYGTTTAPASVLHFGQGVRIECSLSWTTTKIRWRGNIGLEQWVCHNRRHSVFLLNHKRTGVIFICQMPPSSHKQGIWWSFSGVCYILR